MPELGEGEKVYRVKLFLVDKYRGSKTPTRLKGGNIPKFMVSKSEDTLLNMK